MKLKDRLFWIFLIWKLFILLLAAVSSQIAPWNDSVKLLFEPTDSVVDKALRTWLSPLASWDGAYFLDIAIRGYRWEQQHAFFPLLPLLMRVTGKALSWAGLSFSTGCLVAGVVWACLGHALAIQMLFRLGRLILADEYLAYLAAVFYILNPATAYLTGIYSESLFAALCFAGMLCFHRQWRLWAALLFALASACRSNGILMCGFFIFEWLFGLRHPLGWRTGWRLVRTILLVAISLSGFVAFQWWSYSLYCTEARPWCAWKVPLLYNFVQSHYWQVGFLKYYRWSQLPNFLIATPITIFSCWAFYEYGRVDWIRLFTSGLIHRHQSSTRAPFHSRALLPHIYLWAVLLVWTLTVAHVQIVNRLLTCIPALYWAMSHWWVNATWGKNVFLTIITGWAVINTVLFLNFYPPA